MITRGSEPLPAFFFYALLYNTLIRKRLSRVSLTPRTRPSGQLRPRKPERIFKMKELDRQRYGILVFNQIKV